MYNRYFDFREPPFSLAPDPAFLYMSRRHQEGLAHLLYGINSGGFVVLTGEVGTGKTTLCHCLLHQLPDDVDIALILNPKLNSLELLANICDELGIAYHKKDAGLKDFTDLLNKYLLDAHARGRRTVLMIDEAQNLSLDVLEQIRLLTNLETSKTKLLQIVLVGQPELKKMLNQRELRQLNQRITARYHLEPLNLDETLSYIQHRLAISGGDARIFDKSAIRRIYGLSHGIPRLINLLCDRALLGAYAKGVQSVTAKMVNQAAKEVLDSERNRPAHAYILFFVLLVVTAGLLAFHVLTGFYKRNNVPLAKADPSDAVLENPLVNEVDLPGMGTLLAPEDLSLPSLSSDPEEASEPTPGNFTEFIANPGRSFENAFGLALKLWGEVVPEGSKAGCDSVKSKGFRCFVDQGSLKDVLRFNRPAVLEFSLADGQKRHALLAGMDRGYPIIQSSGGKEVIFPLEAVLNHWQGYYLILWKTPLAHNQTGIYPGRYSPGVLWLRKQLDKVDGQDSIHAPQPDFFDRLLEERVKLFQRLHGLQADGIVGPRTIILLQNASNTEHFPRLKHTD